MLIPRPLTTSKKRTLLQIVIHFLTLASCHFNPQLGTFNLSELTGDVAPSTAAMVT